MYVLVDDSLNVIVVYGQIEWKLET